MLFDFFSTRRGHRPGHGFARQIVHETKIFFSKTKRGARRRSEHWSSSGSSANELSASSSSDTEVRLRQRQALLASPPVDDQQSREALFGFFRRPSLSIRYLRKPPAFFNSRKGSPSPSEFFSCTGRPYCSRNSAKTSHQCDRTAAGGAPEKGCEKNKRKFWALLVYTRAVSWGREFETVSRYILRNTLEALKLIAYQPRTSQWPSRNTS
jgi:hypothetical protein